MLLTLGMSTSPRDTVHLPCLVSVVVLVQHISLGGDDLRSLCLPQYCGSTRPNTDDLHKYRDYVDTRSTNALQLYLHARTPPARYIFGLCSI